MRRGRRGRTVRALLATLAACVLVPVAGPAHAEEPESWVRVSVDGIRPALPKRDGSVRLTGTVTNTSDDELSNLQAIFWRSLDPIQDREGMTQALASDANEPLGKRQVENYQNIPSENDRTLGPGESTRFDLTAEIGELDFPDFDGVYLIGVHIRGQTEPQDANRTLGRARIFLPLVETPPERSARIISVVLLTSRPSLVREGVLADDHLAGEIRSEGRLRLLLSAAAADQTSFAIDPALVEELETMADGYQVLDSAGSTSPGRGQAAAVAWLADFQRLQRTADGFRLPYGNPDLAALVHDGQQQVLELSADAGQEIEATDDLPLLVMPAGGTADEATVRAADALDPDVILLSNTSVRGSTDPARGPLRAGPGEAPIVVYQLSAAKGGPGPEPRRTPAKLQQRTLADTWLEATGADNGSPVGRVRVITGPAQAAAADADADVPAPWLRRSTLSELLKGKPAEWNQRYRYPDKAAEAQLTDEQLGAVRRLSEDYETAADLLVDSDEAEEAAWVALPRAASSAWRGEEVSARRYTAILEGQVSDLLRKVEISAIPQVLTTGRTATFPITVLNNIPADPEDPAAGAVRLRLRFTSANSQRLTVAPKEFEQVPAEGRVTADAEVKAQTNGTVRVVAQLETESGTAVGRPKTIAVQVTQAGTAGWFIALAAGIVLIGTTALRIRQVARERSHESAEPIELSRPAEEQPDTSQHSRETLDV